MIRCAFALACALAVLPMVAHATEIAGSCRGDNVATDGLYGDEISTTSSTAIETGLTITVDNKGTPADCILILFSGSVKTSPGTYIVVRATVDGGVVLGSIRLASSQHTAFETGAASFLASVSKGVHTIKIQYRSTAGTAVWMRNRFFTVHYKGL